MYYRLDKDGYIQSMSLDTVIAGGACYDGILPDELTEENFYAWKVTTEGLVFDEEKLKTIMLYEENEAELIELLSWFEDYDRQIMQYQRCGRLGQAYDKSIAELDAQAEEKQQRIREIRKTMI